MPQKHPSTSLRAGGAEKTQNNNPEAAGSAAAGRGIEPNAVSGKAQAHKRVAVVVPDDYDAACKEPQPLLIYETLNASPAIWAQRVFFRPDDPAESRLTLEQHEPLENMDAIWVVASSAAQIERFERMRQAGDPPVIISGAAAHALERVPEWAAAAVKGDIETALVELCAALERGDSASELRRSASSWPGAAGPGTRLDTVSSVTIENLDDAPHLVRPPVPCSKSKKMLASVEASRLGTDGTLRLRSAPVICRLADELLANTGEPCVELRGPGFYSRADFYELFQQLLPILRKHRAQLRIESDPPRLTLGGGIPELTLPVMPSFGHEPASRRVVGYLVRWAKRGAAADLSQIFASRYFERACRRARLPLVYRGDKRPAPAFSFGPATPAGIESRCEHLVLLLESPKSETYMLEHLRACLPEGMEVLDVRPFLASPLRHPQPRSILYRIEWLDPDAQRRLDAHLPALRAQGIAIDGGRLELHPQNGEFHNFTRPIQAALGLNDPRDLKRVMTLTKIDEVLPPTHLTDRAPVPTVHER